MGWDWKRLGRWAGRLAAPLLALAVATAPALLPGPARGQETGRLLVRITDHREAIADFTRLPVTIAAVAVHPAGQPRREGWLRLLVPAPVVDLVQATREPVMLLEAPVPPGAYDAVRLEMDRGRGTLGSGEEVAVAVPSRGMAAVSFRVKAGQATVLTLDLVVHDLTDHPGKRYGVAIRRATVNP
ncbi:MAG: DUF4382 domain-containing protein [Candidatus Methylomirabilales bacterium]